MEWAKEVNRHCREIQYDPEDINRGHGNWIRMIHAPSFVSKEKADGPEDITVPEMIQESPTEVRHVVTDSFRVRFRGESDASSSCDIVQLVLVRKADAKQSQVIRGCRDIAAAISDGEVVCVSTCLEGGNDTGTAEVVCSACVCVWRKGFGCKHIQVLLTSRLQAHSTVKGKKTGKEHRHMENTSTTRCTWPAWTSRRRSMWRSRRSSPRCSKRSEKLRRGSAW